MSSLRSEQSSELEQFGVSTRDATTLEGKRVISIEKITTTLESTEKMKSGELTHNHMGDILQIDAQILVLSGVAGTEKVAKENILSLENGIKQKLEQRLNNPSVNLIEELSAPNPEADNLGGILAKCRVLGELSTLMSQGKSKSEAISELRNAYLDTRRNVLQYKDYALRKSIVAEESVAFWNTGMAGIVDSGNVEEIAIAKRELARVIVAKETGKNLYTISKVELAQLIPQVLEKQIGRLSRREDTERQAVGLDSLTAYAFEKGVAQETIVRLLDILPEGYEDIRDEYMGGRKVEITSATTETREVARQLETPRVESLRTRENVLYAPDVIFFGDQHGDIETLEDTRTGVYLGDIVDMKDGLDKNSLFEYGNIRGNLEKWINRVESGQDIYVVGNHDVTLAYMYLLHNQLDRSYEQNNVLRTQKLEEEFTSVFQHWYNLAGGDIVLGQLGIDFRAENASHRTGGENPLTVRNVAIRIFDTETVLARFAQTTINHGRLYAIVNENLAMHTLPQTDENGNLVTVEEGFTGLDALDLLQQRMRSGDIDTFKRLFFTDWKVNNQGQPSGVEYHHGPLWNRETAVERYLPKQSESVAEQGNRKILTDKLITQINSQAGARGTLVKRVVFGHIQQGGSADEEGLIINVDLATDANKRNIHCESHLSETTEKFSYTSGKKVITKNQIIRSNKP